MEYKELITLVAGFLIAVVAIGETKVENRWERLAGIVVAGGVFVSLGWFVR